jgi:uncharacterized SAM-binding protein YcdF (DUF218 family)
MYFLASKTIWALTAPTTFLLLLTALGILLAILGKRRAGLWLAGVGMAVTLFVAMFPVGPEVARVIEERFPACTEPDRIDGVIVLGGAVDPITMRDRKQLSLNEAAERMIAMADIARRHPDWRVVFTGGSAAILTEKLGEAEAIEPYLGQLGIAPGRILLEGKSRNTYENALFTAELLKPQPGQRFMLVTSALHMARSVGLFRKAGFDVLPCPVDYITATSGPGFIPSGGFSDNLRRLDGAMREVMGLMAARMLGQTDTLFPAP